MTRHPLAMLSAVAVLLLASPAIAQKQYGPGATDTEIKIGNINPYSGPASAYGMIGRTIAAYFGKVNAEGGVNGRKITFISYDDGYSPPKTVEQARKLVESDEVLLIFQSLGTAHNTAIERYMNGKGVPQLFVATGATKFGDPTNFPWTMGWQPNYQSESRIYAKYLVEQHANGKIGVLYQNDDYGKDYLKGLKDGLAARSRSCPSRPTRPPIRQSIPRSSVSRRSGADIFFNVATPKFAAQAIRKVAELDWHRCICSTTCQFRRLRVETRRLENAKGVLSTAYFKDPTDPTWQDDAAFKDWLAFMDKYFPDGDRTSSFTVYGYAVCPDDDHVLKQCGDDLTRANVMKQAASLKGLTNPMLLPGITINTSATDYFPIEQMQMMRFTGERWELFGPVLSGQVGS